MLPTAEDVEAMIQSMRSEETCLDEETPSSQSGPTPTAPPPSTTSMTSTGPSSHQLAYSHTTGIIHVNE
jgi:hypothetical protein